MYRNAYQHGMLTIFFSCGSKPLNIWETHTQDGYISRFLDQDIKSMVLEIGGTNVSTTYMICPKGNTVLGITMPFLVMIVKNLKKYFSFEVTILDETNTRRRFRVSNFQSSTQILPLCTVMPIGLSEGWNQIQFNLAEFTRRAYKKQFVEVQKLKINANIRLRRIYFTERLVPEDQLPPEYKLYFPLASKGAKGKKPAGPETKEAEAQPPTVEAVEVQADVPPEEPRLASKPGSKASVHSMKKSQSKVVSAAQLEGVPEGAGEGAEAPAEGEVTEEPAEGEPAEGEPAEGAPAEGEQTPVENEQAGGEGDEVPPEGDQAPPEGEAPPEGDQAPPEGDEAPAEGDQPPAEEEPPAAGDEEAAPEPAE